jgi:cytosine/uracil/thiamine/allantoin permease
VARPRGVLASVGRDHTGRYGWLLVLILGAVATQLIVPGTIVGTMIVAALQAATVVAALGVVETGPRPRTVVLSVALGAALLAIVVTVLEPYTALRTDLPLVVARTAGLLLAGAVPVIIARDVAHHRRITLQTVAAGLCVYLLLGLAFGFAHGIVDLTIPDAYTEQLGEDDAVYLSFVTLTTVGFGDVTPVAGAARAVTVLEAVIGQIYLVSIVALLVGNVGLVRNPALRRGDQEPDDPDREATGT